VKKIKVAMNGAGISDITLDASRFKGIGHAFPEKRILTKKHFAQALGEISPSTYEDLLKKMRQFDQKYGRGGKVEQVKNVQHVNITIVNEYLIAMNQEFNIAD